MRSLVSCVGLLVSLGFSPIAAADGLFTVGEREVARIASDELCSGRSECALTLLRQLSGIRASVSARGGVAGMPDGARGGGSIKLSGEVEMPMGTIDSHLTFAFLSPKATRIDLALGDIDAFFICTDAETNAVRVSPFAALRGGCKTNAAFAWGVGLPRVRWDPRTDRISNRWAALNLFLNVMRNGLGSAYIRRHLNLKIGTDIETIWYGRQAVAGAKKRATHVRGIVGMDGLLRSQSGLWEMRTSVDGRPSLGGSKMVGRDWLVEAELSGARNFMIAANISAFIGWVGEVSYATRPQDAASLFAAGQERWGFFAGARLGISHGYEPK